MGMIIGFLRHHDSDGDGESQGEGEYYDAMNNCAEEGWEGIVYRRRPWEQKVEARVRSNRKPQDAGVYSVGLNSRLSLSFFLPEQLLFSRPCWLRMVMTIARFEILDTI